jgi:hypothetical protein
MIDVLTRLIPWLQGSPTWVQGLVIGWVVYSAVVVIAVILTPRTLSQQNSESPNPPAASPPAAKTESKASNERATIHQETRGDNSPAIAGVEGDVTINNKQMTTNQKKKKGQPK